MDKWQFYFNNLSSSYLLAKVQMIQCPKPNSHYQDYSVVNFHSTFYTVMKVSLKEDESLSFGDLSKLIFRNSLHQIAGKSLVSVVLNTESL